LIAEIAEYAEEQLFGISFPVMTTPDQERLRVAGVYSAMSDEELCQIATSGDDFSDAAREAFQAEVVKRGLKIEIAPPHGEDVIEFEETVTLRQFLDLPEALLAKGRLESVGIQAYLVDDNMVRLNWFISNILGGIKLKVRAEDAEAASEILNQPIPEMLDVEGVGNFDQPKCPQCQSLDVTYTESVREWVCKSCGSVVVGYFD
jgi:ribosomal protein S27E